MTNKYFNIAGPCNAKDHYMIDSLSRNSKVMQLIERKQYFVIHAARQSGKTTLLLDLVDKLNKSGDYYALYCSLEVAQGITDYEAGIMAIIQSIHGSIKYTNLPHKFFFSDYLNESNVVKLLETSIKDYTALLDKPFVILFDEADCLSDSTLISFLRQLRSGYVTRSSIPFAASVALVGMRNIRDYKSRIRDNRETLGSASPFNIITEALTINNFAKNELISLYNQHTLNTNQNFEKDALDFIWQQTSGQPWLVNAIAREIIEKEFSKNYKLAITKSAAAQAIQTIILRRDTHIDSLLERLKDERVRKVMESVITGKLNEVNLADDDTQYCLDMGLLKRESGEILPSNRIYNEVIIRSLTYNTQFHLETQVENKWAINGKIDMIGLLKGFQQFWRENADIWIEKYQYKEAAPHLILQAYLQRIINGGGQIMREYASNRNRMDLCVIYHEHKYPIELKLKYTEKTQSEGIKQLSKYMDSLGQSEGYLLIFDRSSSKSWAEKIAYNQLNIENKLINIFTC